MTKTTAQIDAEIADLQTERDALSARLRDLRRDRKVAAKAEEDARALDLGRALLATGGDRELVTAKLAELLGNAPVPVTGTTVEPVSDGRDFGHGDGLGDTGDHSPEGGW